MQKDINLFKKISIKNMQYLYAEQSPQWKEKWKFADDDFAALRSEKKL